MRLAIISSSVIDQMIAFNPTWRGSNWFHSASFVFHSGSNRAVSFSLFVASTVVRVVVVHVPLYCLEGGEGEGGGRGRGG